MQKSWLLSLVDDRDDFSKLMPTDLKLAYLWNFDCITKGVATNSWPLDVLWGQPIKLIQVASTSELLENQRNTLFSLKLFPVISAGPKKYKHKTGHKLTF